MDGHAVSPLDLSRTLPVGGGLLVPYSLSGAPVIKQLMQIVTMVPGQGGWVQSLGWEDPLEKGKATIPVFWPGEYYTVHGVAKNWT